MKNKSIHWSLVMVMAFGSCYVSCKKDPSKSKEKFVATAYINGAFWEADMSSASLYGSTDLMSISFAKSKQINPHYRAPWELIGITFIRKHKEPQKLWKKRFDSQGHRDTLYPYGTFNIPQGDGHLLCHMYDVWDGDSVNNWVQITKEENAYQKLWGKLSMTLIRVRSCDEGDYPDTIVVRDCTFYAEMK